MNSIKLRATTGQQKLLEQQQGQQQSNKNDKLPNQSINQLPNQSINQLPKQPINQLPNQSINQLSNQSINHLFLSHRLLDGGIVEEVGQPGVGLQDAGHRLEVLLHCLQGFL